MQREIRELIAVHGFAIRHVLSNGTDPPYSYTVGLQLAGYPELLSSGLTLPIRTAWMLDLGFRMTGPPPQYQRVRLARQKRVPVRASHFRLAVNCLNRASSIVISLNKPCPVALARWSCRTTKRMLGRHLRIMDMPSSRCGKGSGLIVPVAFPGKRRSTHIYEIHSDFCLLHSAIRTSPVRDVSPGLSLPRLIHSGANRPH